MATEIVIQEKVYQEIVQIIGDVCRNFHDDYRFTLIVRMRSRRIISLSSLT